MTLSDLHTLGRSGLPVSPLCLGTMTFGTPRWGSPDEVSEAIFHAYVEACGNFIDTADVYAKGRSEELVGGYIAAAGLRDDLVLATKFSFNPNAGKPMLGGNGRKNLHRALEGSLRRLQTDYVDLYWLHVWDQVTPPEEILQSMGEVIAAGKVRYFGLSDVPAWFATRMATLAEVHGVPGPIALQMPYSLDERSIEREHVPAALALGMGITPWSPLGAGILTGKYRRDASGTVAAGGGRLDLNLPSFQKFNDHSFSAAEVLRTVAGEAGVPMAKMALAWTSARPGVTSLILGAKTVEQLRENVSSLELVLSAEQMKALDEGTVKDKTDLYRLFGEPVRKGIFGGTSVSGWR